MEKYPYLKDNTTGEVRKEYKQLMDFILDQYEQFFVDSKSRYGTALANKPATYRNIGGREKLVSNLSLHLIPEGGDISTAK